MISSVPDLHPLHPPATSSLMDEEQLLSENHMIVVKKNGAIYLLSCSTSYRLRRTTWLTGLVRFVSPTRDRFGTRLKTPELHPHFLLPNKQREATDGCEVVFDALTVAFRFTCFDCISADSSLWMANTPWKAYKQGLANPFCYSAAQ